MYTCERQERETYNIISQKGMYSVKKSVKSFENFSQSMCASTSRS